MGSLLITWLFAVSAFAADRTVVLDNGLTVLLREEHERPLISVCLYVNGGARTESADLQGLSHYYEHIVFRGGTEKQKEEEMRRRFDTLERYGGYTSDDFTGYYFLVPKANLDEALWRFADGILNLQVTGEKIEKDRQSIVQELHMRVSDSPEGRASQLLTETAFQKSAYRVGAIGTEAVVTGAQIDKFKTFYQERYVPNQMLLAVVGDFSSDEMLEKLRAQFRRYPRGKTSFELGIDEPRQADVREAIDGRESALSYIEVGFKIPAASDPDTPALQVLNAALSGGRASRLVQRLREREAICTDVSSDAPLRKDPYLLDISMQCKPENEEKAIRTLLAELKRLRDEPIATDELSRVRAQLEHDYLLAHESYQAQAESLCEFALLGRAAEEPNWLTALLNVSPETIQRVAREIFVSDGCTLAIVRPKADKTPSYAAAVREALPRSESATSATKAAPIVLRQRDKKFGFMQVLKEDRSAPLFSAAVVIRGGPLLEAAGKAGVANLVGRMVLRGTADLTADQVATKLAAEGLTLQEDTNRDHLLFTLSGPSRSVSEAVKLVMSLLAAPAFRADDLENARKEALAEIAAEADDSYALADRELFGTLYPGVALGRDRLGDAASVAALTAADLSAYHKAAFVPRNVYLSVVGDVAALELAKQVEQTVEGLPLSKELPKLPEIARKEPEAVETRTVPRDTRQVVLDLGWPGPAVTASDYLAAKVASRILGLRLFYRFVYEQGVAYRMWTLLPAQLSAAPLYFQLGVAPENFGKARADLLAQTKAMLDELADPQVSLKTELDDVRRAMIQNFQLSLETTQGQATAYAYYEAAQIGMDFVDSYAEKVNAVKRGAITEAAKKYFDPSRYLAVTVRKGS